MAQPNKAKLIAQYHLVRNYARICILVRVSNFVYKVTAHNEQNMAVGTDTGVYFKAYGVQGIRKVLNCENVSQIEVLEKYHILLVLSGKYYLFVARVN